jgi:hypothetical protein
MTACGSLEEHTEGWAGRWEEVAELRRIRLTMEGVMATADLLEREAPRTVDQLWKILPIKDRTIHVRWSGAAWRTEQNYPLNIGAVENPITWLEPGDIIYYDAPDYGLYKIGICYGQAQWRDHKGELYVTRVGRITDGLAPFIERCERILHEGPKNVVIDRS